MIPEQVLLEEVMMMALASAIEINPNQMSDFDSGRLMAFYELLSVAKSQADLLGVTFGYGPLNTLVPEDLLKKDWPGRSL